MSRRDEAAVVYPLAVMRSVYRIFPLFASIDDLTYSRYDMIEATAAVAELAEAAKAIEPFVVWQVVESCNGNKCRDSWCAGCCGDEEAAASVARANEASRHLRAALSKFSGGAA
jgi:hypothetical protein